MAAAAVVGAGAALWWAASAGERPRRFEDRLRLVTVAGGVLVSVGAVLSYVDTANREIKRPYNERRLALCIEASDAAATLSDTKAASEARSKAQARFETLYWGSLAIFEDSEVEAAYVAFRRQVQTKPVPGSEADDYSLKIAALKISRACRQLVSKAWALDLGPLQLKEKEPGPSAK